MEKEHALRRIRTHGEMANHNWIVKSTASPHLCAEIASKHNALRLRLSHPELLCTLMSCLYIFSRVAQNEARKLPRNESKILFDSLTSNTANLSEICLKCRGCNRMCAKESRHHAGRCCQHLQTKYGHAENKSVPRARPVSENTFKSKRYSPALLSILGLESVCCTVLPQILHPIHHA